MDSTVLDSIPCEIDVEELAKKLHLKSDHSYFPELVRLVREAQALGKPKALYRVAYIESRTDDSVTVEGVTLKSRVLRVNLDAVYRIFPYVATCGLELEAWSAGIKDFLHRFWADAIKEATLRTAREHLEQHLVQKYQLGKISRMSPGSLKDWPIEEQRPLFSILGELTERIGVSLTESLIMVPIKSVSGVWFPAETDFFSCQLCSRDLCPGRKAPYDPELYDQKYRFH